MITLGIETSCDETSVAIYSSDTNRIISSVTYSQIDLHNEFGGIIPEVASRNHAEKIDKVFSSAMKNAKINISEIDAIGVTNRPGLIGSLFVGLSFAKGLSLVTKKPLIGINHLEAHTLIAELEHEIAPPYLSLLISGGNTIIFIVDKNYKFTIASETEDDALGEAFDKVSKSLGGPYPGGAFIEELAKTGDISSVSFTVPMKGRVNFSFSGLKTAVLKSISNNSKKEDIAAAFQHCVSISLKEKLLSISKKNNINNVIVCGGVACNGYIIETLTRTSLNIYVPKKNLCTDNGDMVAYATYKKIMLGASGDRLELDAKDRVYFDKIS